MSENTSRIHEYSLVRLFPKDIDQLVEHIKKLSKDDRYLRFGFIIADCAIRGYVTRTIISDDNQCNFWWGIEDNSEIVGAIHVSYMNDIAEFAMTVDKEYRNQKLGQLLFARGHQLVCEHKISRIFVQCLSENMAVRHIAIKFGLMVMTYGSDADASVNIEYPVPLSKINEIRSNIFMIDKNIGR